MSYLIARQSETVTCENGHPICDVAVDIARHSVGPLPMQFENWRDLPSPVRGQVIPKLSVLRCCIHSSYASGRAPPARRRGVATMKGATYTEAAPAELWWCNSHKRRATHICRNETREWHCGGPARGGIMLPCSAVDLTGAVEVEEVA